VDRHSSSDRTNNEISDGSQVSGSAYQAKSMHFGARSAGLPLVALAAVAGLTFLAFKIADSGSGSGKDESPPAAAGATASPTPSTSAPTPSITPSRTPLNTQTRPPSRGTDPVGATETEPIGAAKGGSTTQCRSHTPTDVGGIATGNPCISVDSNNKVRIYSDFVAEKTGQFTLFVWLIDDSGVPERTVMRYCQVNFKKIGQAQGCSLGNITPPAAGSWGAAVTAQAGAATRPSIWDSGYTGTQSGALRWTPTDG
jgi:hypothetical protein